MKPSMQEISIFAFQERFPDQDTCLQTLAEYKWKDGFCCSRCDHRNYCEGRKKWNRQCTSCKYEESPTAKTLFHKVKFPLYKAFWILYYMATTKKGMSACEMSRKLSLHKNTCWLFRRKVMLAMQRLSKDKLEGFIELLPLLIGGTSTGKARAKEGRKSKNRSRKQRCLFAIERSRAGVCRVYAKSIKKASRKNVLAFIKENISRNAHIRTRPFPGAPATNNNDWHLTRSSHKKGNNDFYYLNRTAHSLEKWLQGIHGNVKDLQPYLDEYCFRFNQRHRKECIFDDLLDRVMKHPPFTYKQIRAFSQRQ